MGFRGPQSRIMKMHHPGIEHRFELELLRSPPSKRCLVCDLTEPLSSSEFQWPANERQRTARRSYISLAIVIAIGAVSSIGWMIWRSDWQRERIAHSLPPVENSSAVVMP